jgi:hypothetical protein
MPRWKSAVACWRSALVKANARGQDGPGLQREHVPPALQPVADRCAQRAHAAPLVAELAADALPIQAHPSRARAHAHEGGRRVDDLPRPRRKDRPLAIGGPGVGRREQSHEKHGQGHDQGQGTHAHALNQHRRRARAKATTLLDFGARCPGRGRLRTPSRASLGAGRPEVTCLGTFRTQPGCPPGFARTCLAYTTVSRGRPCRGVAARGRSGSGRSPPAHRGSSCTRCDRRRRGLAARCAGSGPAR